MKKLKFIDLFAGIGGFRLGFERNGLECVFSAEIDKHACEMYELNFDHNPFCDITTLNPEVIPDFDILCAGFPCQSFSISGKQKGFYDLTRGTLFFDICRILEIKKPKAFVLENVKNLETHDNGNTLRVMLDSLQKLGYSVTYKVINAKNFNVPQNRERIILIGSLDGFHFDFDKLNEKTTDSMEQYLDEEKKFEYLQPEEYTIIKDYKRQEKSGLIFIGYRNKKTRSTGVRPDTEHLSRVHKQPNRIYSSKGTHPTFSSQESSGRYWIHHKNKVRKLTLDECFRFMGFPENFKKTGSNANLYARIGNSVCVTMIEQIAREVKKQFFERGEEFEMTPTQLLENLYIKATEEVSNKKITTLSEEQSSWVKIIVEKEETMKGVYTVLVSSLTYKILNKEQDVRFHKKDLKNGYSGRGFDTKYVTPFLKSKKFFGAMKESGWLTRSLEQPHPFNMDFPGKINNFSVKESFLKILHDVEENNADPEKYLLEIFKLSITEKSKKTVVLTNPINSESKMNIEKLMEYLNYHFFYKYSTRGASILPVIAFYSIYQCLIEEMSRYKNKELDELSSHNSSDRSSGLAGDIVIRDSITKELYEIIEIKFEIEPTEIMLNDAYEKIKTTPIQRYYILSTKFPIPEETLKINEKIIEIREEHGCQVIVNGLMPSLKYYLRLLENTDEFINRYLENVQNNEELDFEHKISWNRVVQ